MSLRAAVKEVESKLGPVDILIANAGIGMENSALSFRGEDFEAQVRVNLIGVANSVAAVLPGMIERKRGHLVAISSLASYRGLPLMAGYCASKSGVNALFESLRLELAPLGIDTTIICPGWIKTPLTAHIGVPKPNTPWKLPSPKLGRMAPAEFINIADEMQRMLTGQPDLDTYRAGLRSLLTACRIR